MPIARSRRTLRSDMAKTKAALIVVSACTDPSREDEFNHWYNDIHLPVILRLPHFVSATRYEIAKPAPGEGKYVAVYELDTDDVESAASALAGDQGRQGIDCIK